MGIAMGRANVHYRYVQIAVPAHMGDPLEPNPDDDVLHPMTGSFYLTTASDTTEIPVTIITSDARPQFTEAADTVSREFRMHFPEDRVLAVHFDGAIEGTEIELPRGPGQYDVRCELTNYEAARRHPIATPGSPEQVKVYIWPAVYTSEVEPPRPTWANPRDR